MWMAGGCDRSRAQSAKIERPFESTQISPDIGACIGAQRAIWVVFDDDGGRQSVLPAAVREEVCRDRGGRHRHSGERLPRRVRDRAFFFFHAARLRAQTPADGQCTRFDAGQSIDRSDGSRCAGEPSGERGNAACRNIARHAAANDVGSAHFACHGLTIDNRGRPATRASRDQNAAGDLRRRSAASG
jgi:hypothetical protein